MRHHKKGRKFGRKKGRRHSFINGLLSNLIMKGRIETTEARAKEIRPLVEKLISLGKKQDLASLRLLKARILNQKAADKMYYDIAPRYKERSGGFTRIIKTARSRMRDAAKVAIIEFV